MRRLVENLVQTVHCATANVHRTSSTPINLIPPPCLAYWKSGDIREYVPLIREIWTESSGIQIWVEKLGPTEGWILNQW